MSVQRKKTIYEILFKRTIDILLSLFFLILLTPLFIILFILVKINLGSPIIYKQKRMGKDNIVFTIYKFRSMTNNPDHNDDLLPDEKRLTKFGKWLRKTSLDELPQLYNILKGNMSFIGPRPKQIIDVFYMDKNTQQRHNVRPGLSGLAQINGRDALSWEETFDYDLKYIEKVTFFKDLKIFFKTFGVVLGQKGVKPKDRETTQHLGDYLLNEGKITEKEYQETKQLYNQTKIL